MSQWWEERKLWQKAAIAFVGYLVAKNTVFRLVASFFGGDQEPTTEPERLVDGGILTLLTVLIFVLLIVVPLLLMLLRTATTTIRDIKLRPNDTFQLPTSDQQPMAPAAEKFDAVAVVDGLEAIGFSRVGSYRCELTDHTAVFACMLSPAGDAVATITPAHLAFTSDFDGKILSTSDTSTMTKYASWVLKQIATTRDPRHVWATHQAGMEHLRRHGNTARRIHHAEVVTTAIRVDEASVRAFSGSDLVVGLMRPKRPGTGKPLGDDKPSDQAIRDWMQGDIRWTTV